MFLRGQVGENNSVYSIEIYDYSKYGIIKLLHAKTKKVEEINISELSKILEVSKEEIAAAIESTNSVDSIYSNEKSSDDQRMLIEKISSNKDDYSTLLDNIILKEIIDNLEERERKIILLRFYKEQTQSQVGKILGITQVQVSRIEKKVLEKMKSKLEAVWEKEICIF